MKKMKVILAGAILLTSGIVRAQDSTKKATLNVSGSVDA